MTTYRASVAARRRRELSCETEPRRLTPTERLHEVTMAAMSRAPSPPEHSVEITRNAKGVAQFEVTVRGYDLDEVIAKALASFAKVTAEHPYPDSNGAA
jgi:hypothetical protein